MILLETPLPRHGSIVSGSCCAARVRVSLTDFASVDADALSPGPELSVDADAFSVGAAFPPPQPVKAVITIEPASKRDTILLFFILLPP